MKTLKKRIFKTTKIGKHLHSILYKLYVIAFAQLSDKQYAKTLFKLRFGYKLNLRNPQTLNEKIQWLKIYDRSPLHTFCADKLTVRSYVKEKIGEAYLIPLIFDTDNPTELDLENLPDFPFIIKPNHSSGKYFIIKDKREINIGEIRKDCTKWLKENTFKHRKEWQYKNISPKILIEKLLLDSNGDIPNDYKFHCFHGKVKFVQVDINRGSREHFRNWYNPDWTRTHFRWSSVVDGRKTDPSIEDINPPKRLKAIIRLSEKLSAEFKYVRVDWYTLENQIYFGELTFHHDGGFRPIYPKEWDLKVGEYLKLDIANTV